MMKTINSLFGTLNRDSIQRFQGDGPVVGIGRGHHDRQRGAPPVGQHTAPGASLPSVHGTGTDRMAGKVSDNSSDRGTSSFKGGENYGGED